MGLSGKVVVVTGASAGIGRAYVLAFAGAGATVVALARTLGVQGDGEAARNTLAQLADTALSLPGHVQVTRCDVSNEDDVARAVDETVTNYGHIDVLVNNAGRYPHHPSLETAVADWERVMRVNVLGCYLMIRQVAPHMLRRGRGSIVNITSRNAQATSREHPGHRDLLAYSVSKAAVNRMTTYLAEDFKHDNIAVNALSPGAVLTDTFVTADPEVAAMARDGGWGKPASADVIGPAMLYLAEQIPAKMTGQILSTDEFGVTWGPAAAVR